MMANYTIHITQVTRKNVLLNHFKTFENIINLPIVLPAAK